MVIIERHNQYIVLKGALPRPLIKAIDDATSYPVKGARYSMAFRSHRWDGREHLLKFNRNKGGYRLPSGMFDDVVDLLVEEDVHIEDCRRKQTHFVEHNWNPALTLRPSQQMGVDAMINAEGTGILEMAIRSGKTRTVARAIHDLRTTALIIVPSQMLLRQTCAALEEALMEKIGVIGDGEWSVEPVTVATVQTLAKRRGGWHKDARTGSMAHIPMDPMYRQLLLATDMVVFDECHHMRNNTWRDVFGDFDAPYRVGLSATVMLNNVAENERGVIWLKAMTGPVRYKVGASDLIEAGVLIRPEIRFYRVSTPNMYGKRWSPDLHDALIVHNEKRNALITMVAKVCTKSNMKVLVSTRLLAHTAHLVILLTGAGMRVAKVTGRERMAKRQQLIQQYLDGTLDVLVGTVFREGVDIPQIEVVINAEGGKDDKTTMQRLRNLTPHDGKTTAIVFDFIDDTNEYFAEHSLARLRAYRSERAFDVKLVNPVSASHM